MNDQTPKTIHFSGEEFLKLSEIAKSFYEAGLSSDSPKLAIFTGGVASGKTTIRKQKYGENYVHFEFGEIRTAVKKQLGKDDPKLESSSFLVSDMIFKDCIENKRNIVTEIIGDNNAVLTPIINKMIELGYKIEMQYIQADPVESYKRHLKLVEEDEDYLSVYFTQNTTLSFFYHHLNLGDMPNLGNK